MQQVELATGKTPKELEHDEPPEALEYLWGWFWSIRKGQGSGMAGPNPLSWSEIWCWANLQKVEPTPFEVDAIRAMDDAYIGAIYDQMEGKKPKGPKVPKRK